LDFGLWTLDFGLFGHQRPGGASQAAKRRKRRKKKKNSSNEATRAAGFTYPTQRMLHDLELRGAEIDQQSVLNPKRTQVAQDLGQLLQPTFSIADSCILRLLRLFAAERLSPPLAPDGAP
jgi:hypothetical protein